MTRVRLIGVVFILCVLGRMAQAHPTPFSNVSINITSDGIDVAVIAYAYDFAHELGLTTDAQAVDTYLVGKRYERLVRLVTDRLILDVDGRAVTPALVDAAASTGSDQKAVTIRLHYAARVTNTLRVTAHLFPYDPLHETFVSFHEDGRLTGEAILTAQQPAADRPLRVTQTRFEVVKRFVVAGIEHIAIGPDHVLFLVGLLLLGGSRWQLVRIITGFTLAHSITLSLAVFNVVAPPARLIEPAIALSICAVGISNLIRSGRRGSADQSDSKPVGPVGKDRRAIMAFGFGLVHGFGFASVLRDMDLPRAALGWSLFAFNLGVEIGQLVIVLVVASLLAWVARTHVVARRRITVAGSVAVLWAGFFWLVQRVFFA